MNRAGRTTASLTVAATMIIGALAAAGPAGASARSRPTIQVPTTAAANATEKVVVILADQLAATPADKARLARRTAVARSEQQSVLSRLAGPAPTNVKHFTVGNAFSATVTVAQAAALAADPGVRSVTEDKKIAVASTAAKAAATPKLKAAAAPAPVAIPAGVCSSNPKKPTLEPEALQTLKAASSDPTAKTASALGIDGSGVKVAYIADGIDPDNPGFLRKDGTSAVTDYQDFSGDGPSAPSEGAEAYGDVSSMVAQGNIVYDLATYANASAVSFPGGHCYARIVGVSPGADMVGLKVISLSSFSTSSILQAIDYAVTVAHVDVLNESFGNPGIVPDPGSRNDIAVFDEQAVAAGVTVTVSSGDSGITNTIGAPDFTNKVITVGATTDSRAYEQTGYALAPAFGNGTWVDNNISALSSAGVTSEGRTVDVSAPGEADWAVCDDSGNFFGCTDYNPAYNAVQLFGGTSQSAPLTAGVAALVIQAYRKTHGGASPSPALVKTLITSTATDLDFSGEDQGSGLVDARAAVEAALTYPGATKATPGVSSNIAVSADQLLLEGHPGALQHGSVTVTNVGTTPLTVLPSTRQYAVVANDTTTATLAATDPTVPYPLYGAPAPFTTQTFTVPSGVDVLNASEYWNSGAAVGGKGGVVRMSLFDPNGAFQTNTRPQGGSRPANYGTVLVRHPVAGTWTAVFYSYPSYQFFGKITLNTTSLRAVPVGSVSPSFTLAPGASKAVSVTLKTPSTGGDQTYTLDLASSGGHRTAVPVIMRAVVDTSSGPGHFVGTITGGNARAPYAAERFSYELDVPPGKHDLDVSVVLPHGPGDVAQGFLVDPRGEVESVDQTLTADGTATYNGWSNVVANPVPGRWKYLVEVADPVTGTELNQTFQGTVTFDQQKVAVTGLPTNGTLAKGKGHQVTVTVTNTGRKPMSVQTDAHSNWTRQVQLVPLASSTVDLPGGAAPPYLVPPNTSKLSVSAAATLPAQVDLQSPIGGIEVAGDLQQAKAGSTISTATVSEPAPYQVGRGFWFSNVNEIGPFTDAGAPTGSANVVATATMKAFDSAVTSSTGDPYLAATDAGADSGTPVVIQPGHTATITVTIAPTVAKGVHTSGVLNIVTTPEIIQGPIFNTIGDVVASFPYSYTVS